MKNFNSLRVIELASVLAGPSVGQFFAELGAEVVKIENPETLGDVTRSWLAKDESPETEGVSAYFSCVNWGKKSVLLNLKTQKEQLYRLVQTADIVIASYKPGDAEKLGVDYDTLREFKTDLIYGHITGYGLQSSKVGYDAVIQAESGFMSINGEEGGGPLKMPVALIDVLAAHHLKEGLLLALIQRMMTRRGNYVPVSLLDAAVSSLANQATNWLVGGKTPTRKGNAHPNIAPYGDIFSTKDNQQLMLAVGNDKQFLALSEVLDLDLTQEKGFSTNSLRVQHRSRLKTILEKAILNFNSVELTELLEERKVPVGIVKSIDQVFDKAPASWLLENEQFKGVRNLMSLPSNFEKMATLSAPPSLGEHTDQILSAVS